MDKTISAFQLMFDVDLVRHGHAPVEETNYSVSAGQDGEVHITLKPGTRIEDRDNVRIFLSHLQGIISTKYDWGLAKKLDDKLKFASVDDDLYRLAEKVAEVLCTSADKGNSPTAIA